MTVYFTLAIIFSLMYPVWGVLSLLFVGATIFNKLTRQLYNNADCLCKCMLLPLIAIFGLIMSLILMGWLFVFVFITGIFYSFAAPCVFFKARGIKID